jgi:dienelactone hydrolase
MPARPLLRLGVAIIIPLGGASAQQFPIPQPSPTELARTHYHRVTSKRSPAPEPGAENTELVSPLTRPDGARVSTAGEWYATRRPELVNQWVSILGKIAPAEGDRKWFGDITKVYEQSRREEDGYTRIDLDIPIETDFVQRHLLLMPKGQGNGPFPAVIAWTSSTPDYREPEQSWGAYLARHGYVVLTSWAFIRNYRQGTRGKQAADLVYERFGHWLGMGKMVHDVAREIEYLRTVPAVDSARIGFMGFSLSAKTAVYVAAFNPDVKVTVAVDPHIAINGGTNWYAPWYLDWLHKFDDIHTPDYPIPELRGTVQSLLNPDPRRPGFEHDHHELLALAAPRPFLLIGGSQSEDAGGDSDDLQSWAYVNRAKEVYSLLGVPERLQFCSTNQGHHATGQQSDPAWQAFLKYYLVDHPVRFEGYRRAAAVN